MGFLSLMEKRGCFSIKKKKRKKRERERFENFKIFTGTGPPLGSWLPQLQPTVRKTAEIDIHEKSKNCILNIHFKCSHWSSEKWESFDRKSSVFLYLCQGQHLYMMRLPFLLYLLYFHQKKILLRNLTKYGANKRSSAIFFLLSFSLYFT